VNRRHLIEIEDQPWCPRVIRDYATDYLQFAIVAWKAYASVMPLLADALKRTCSRQILDLCSGGAGPWVDMLPALRAAGVDAPVRLTDKYPNREAFDHANRESHGAITGHLEPVDATAVPADLTGFRTMFSAFHHFRPEQARAILADAFNQRQGIAVFEAGQRDLKMLLSMFLVPLAVWVLTPFIRPFRWSRLLWTYLIPAVPLIILFDGFVSCLRFYSVEELRSLTIGLASDGYAWSAGTVEGKRVPMPVTYLIGVPIDMGKT
jgi:hypothetical protein